MSGLTTSEHSFRSHMMMFGERSYPVRKVQNGKWAFDRAFGVGGTPIFYKTRKEAVRAVELYLHVLSLRLHGEAA